MLDTMIDVFFRPGEASMQRAKASTANYWQDGFIALAVTLFFFVMLYFLDFLLDAIFTPNRPPIAPNERIEAATGLFMLLLIFVVMVLISVMVGLMVDIGITTVLVRFVSGQWPQIGPYFFINILCISPILVLSPIVDFISLILPVNGEALTSIIFTPLGLYQLYLHYLNIKVSFNLSGTNAAWVIVLPLIVFICALPCLFLTTFPLFLMSKP